MRLLALVTVAVAVVPSAYSYPLFKRSDTHLDAKDQKSERTSLSAHGSVSQVNSDGCLTGVVVATMHSTVDCNFGASSTSSLPADLNAPSGIDPIPLGTPEYLGPPQNLGQNQQYQPQTTDFDEGDSSQFFLPTGEGVAPAAYQPNRMSLEGGPVGLLPNLDRTLTGSYTNNPGVTQQLSHLLNGQGFSGLTMKEAKKDEDTKTKA